MTGVALLLALWLVCVFGFIRSGRGSWLFAMWAVNGGMWVWSVVLLMRALA